MEGKKYRHSQEVIKQTKSSDQKFSKIDENYRLISEEVQKLYTQEIEENHTRHLMIKFKTSDKEENHCTSAAIGLKDTLYTEK